MNVTSSDFRARARGRLAGSYGISLLVCLVSAVLLNIGTSLSGSVSFSNISNVCSGNILGALVVGSGISFLSGLLAIASWVISGPVSVGRTGYFIKLADGEKPAFEHLFRHFRNFLNCFAVNFLVQCLTILWCLPAIFLFLVSIGILMISGLVRFSDYHSFETIFTQNSGLTIGLLSIILLFCIAIAALTIIAKLRYGMALYIVAEHPEIGASNAIRMSKQMMNGNKGRLFSLYISFAGWFVLACCTLGIGFFFLQPYFYTAEAEFFNEISGKNYQRWLMQQAFESRQNNVNCNAAGTDNYSNYGGTYSPQQEDNII